MKKKIIYAWFIDGYNARGNWIQQIVYAEDIEDAKQKFYDDGNSEIRFIYKT